MKTKAEVASQNSVNGQSFETLFLKQAQRTGLLALKNHLTAKMMGSGHVQVIKSELDYKLINQAGRVGYFDCKTFGKDYFVFSEIKEQQIERASLYNDWGVPSGFVVYFREVNSVNFFSGKDIKFKGEGNSFSHSEGKKLGMWDNFDLKILLK